MNVPKLLVRLALAILSLIAALYMASWCFRLLNIPSDLAVAAGVIGLLAAIVGYGWLAWVLLAQLWSDSREIARAIRPIVKKAKEGPKGAPNAS